MRDSPLKSSAPRNKVDENIGPNKGPKSKENTGDQSSGRSLKGKLLRSYLSIALLGMAALLVILGTLVWEQGFGRKEQQLTATRARGAVQTLVGIHHSLSALRAWILLGDLSFKEERRSAWKDEIYPALDELEQLSREWGDSEELIRFREVKVLLKKLEYEQWWIEDVAQVPGNEPAKVLFSGEATWLANKVLFELTTVIDIEKLLPAGRERKKLLGQIADLRGNFAQAHTHVNLFVWNGSDDDKQKFNQHIEIVLNKLGRIQANETLLSQEERERLKNVDENLIGYEEIARHVMHLRGSSKWNLARNWLDWRAIPLVTIIDKIFREMTLDQFEQIREEKNHEEQLQIRLILMTLFSIFVLAVTALILSNKHANKITRPIKALAQAAEHLSSEGLSEGGGQAMILPGDNDEIGDLVVSFNRMQQNLQEKSGEARNRLQEVEQKNQIMARTKRTMTGIMKELRENKSNLEESLEKLGLEQKALKKSNLELDSFVYTASHDLRAPLRGINSFSKFLEEDYADRLDDEGRDYLKRIRKGVGRMVQLIDDLLSLSRITRQDNPYETVQVDQLIRSVTERIEFDLETARVDLVIPKHLPVLRCDRIKMAEVFLNLLNNAIKFSQKDNHDGPKVEIGYEEQNGDHRFFVKDNGIGIDPKYHEKVFDIFQRLHTRGEYEGTGAGLSIVKRVIDDHKGRIWIESELGKGTTFHFTIPKKIEAE